MRKLMTVIILVLLTGLFSGCGQSADAKVSTVIFNKNGQVTGVTIEDFSQDNYKLSELEAMVEEAIGDYNASFGAESVVLKSLTVENNIAKMIIQYQTAKDYQEFNQKVLFIGTVKEAIEQGYDLNVTLTDAKDTDKSVMQEEIEKMQEATIIITEEPMHVRAFKNMKYYSEEAEKIDAKEIDTYNVNGYSYIIL